MTSPAEPAIDIQHLIKRYGNFTAVDDISLTIAPGSVCGLLGPNGAGKTSTFKCLLGFAQPTSGSIRIDGRPLEPATFNKLAFVPEKPALFDYMTVNEHLITYSGLHVTYDPARAAELIKLFDLDLKKKAKKLSKGQRTMLGLTLAFAIRPSIFVLDEPTSGLDPIHQRQVLDLIIDVAAGGATVLFASHQISQVERAADRVAIIKRGKLVLDGDTDTLRGQEKLVQAMFEGAIPSLNGITTDPRIRKTEQAGRLLRLYVSRDSDDIARKVTALGAKSVDITDISLEDVFMNLMSEPA
jgi:ABC-2 type transport system ATP-binding protein